MRVLVAAGLLALALLVPAAARAGSSPPHVGIVTGAGAHGPGLKGLGASLFAANCSSCHGALGQGVPKPTKGAGGVVGQGPPLRGAGALAADFYLRTGYMPLKDPRVQPSRSRVLFDDRQIRALVAYVASLGHGPAIPHPQPQLGSIAAGQKLFTQSCAGCHQIATEGGYVTGARVPPLEDASSRQIAQAVRIGPYVMPKFSSTQISAAQLNDLIAYVQYAKHPDDRGGWSIGHLGPWPEGLVTWLIAIGALVCVCLLFGKRLRS
jgi:ubiquinol-cytochrome c reductase cytochrome c subunit